MSRKDIDTSEAHGGGMGLTLILLAGLGALCYFNSESPSFASTILDHATHLSSNGTDVSWLWTTYSTEGSGAFRYHHTPLAQPPHGNTPNGLNHIHIAHFDPHHPHVFGDPTISPEDFLKWAQHAGVRHDKNGKIYYVPSPIYSEGVAMDVYYKLYLDGVDPRAWAAITMAEDHGGTDKGWYAAGTDNYINELYNPHITNNHRPGFTDRVSHGYHYMDFSPYGNEGSTVGVAYANALFAYYYDKGINNPIALERLLAGGSQNAAHNTEYWLNHLQNK